MAVSLSLIRCANSGLKWNYIATKSFLLPSSPVISFCRVNSHKIPIYLLKGLVVSYIYQLEYYCSYGTFQQNGFILKRRNPIPVYSKLQTADSVMRNVDPIHEEYEVVENTNQRRLPQIEVILKKYVEGVLAYQWSYSVETIQIL